MTELSHFKATQADFLPGPDCYQNGQDWVEECKLLLNGLLALTSKEIMQSKLCLNLGWTNRKNTHKVAKSFSGSEEGSKSSLTEVPRFDKAEV